MALDPVPWFIGGAAEHSAEAARNLAWNATQGRTGVATPDSMVVSALPTPGGGVRISPGGAAIESTYPGAHQQSYTVRNDASTTLSIPGNTSSSTVYRRIAAVIKDPQYAGSVPSDPANGPYTEFTATLYWPTTPHIRLASVGIPANTSVITNSMLADARELLNPRRQEVVFGRPRVTADGSAGTTLSMTTDSGGEYFPGGNGSPNQFQVFIPEWANRLMIDASWMAVRYQSGTNSWGQYWVEFGDEYRNRTWPGNQQFEFATQKFQYDSPGSTNNTMRTNWQLMDALPVPAKLKGKSVTFAFKAGRSPSAPSRDVMMDALSGLGMRLTFAEEQLSYDAI